MDGKEKRDRQEEALLQNKEYDLQRHTYEIFLLSVGGISGLSIILSLLQRNFAAALLYVGMGALALGLKLYTGHRKNYMPAAVFFFLLMEFIMLPAEFVLEGGMFGPIPIWACVNIMFLFLFFSGELLRILFIGIVLEYGYLLSRIYYEPQLAGIPESRGNTFLDYLFCFLTAVLWLGLVLHRQEQLFEKENRRIDENNEIIKEAGAARNHFFSDIAYEMRTPIHTMLAVTELLLKEEPNPVIRSEITEIKSASYDMLSVIDDALIYSGLEAGKIVLDEREFRLETLLLNILDSVSDEIAEKKLVFLVIIDPRLPRLVCGDSHRIRQVFTHLLSASLSLTTEGRIMLHLSWKREEGSEEATFVGTVSDTGKGIETEEAGRLFGPDDASWLDGAGLKFCISREYLKLMNGTLEVKGIENVGTTATFTFTCRILDDSPMTEIKRNPGPKALVYAEDRFRTENWRLLTEGLKIQPRYVHNRHRFEMEIRDTQYEYIFLPKSVYEELIPIIAYYHCEENTYVVADSCDKYGDFGKCRMIRRPLSCINMGKVLNGEWEKEDYLVACNQENFSARGSRVLVIDDNTVNLKVAAGIFAKYDVDIDIAADGREGLKKMKKESYDLIFLDLVMPEMSGEEVLARIRELGNGHYRKAPVIAVSSGTEEDMLEYVLKKGFQGFLEKPVRAKNIEECMLRFLPEGRIVYREKKKTEGHREEFIQDERGLQVTKGLSNIGNNEEAYAAILNTYYRENLKKLDRLSDVFRKEELSVFVSAVHGIKSTSASIGAMGLSSLARELEYAGKDENLGFISEKLPLFLKEYKLILDEINTYLLENGKLETAAESDVSKTEQKELKEEPLRELKEKMDRMDLKACSEILEQLFSVNYGEEKHAAICRMKESYDRFDFHTAKKELGELLSGFETGQEELISETGQEESIS